MAFIKMHFRLPIFITFSLLVISLGLSTCLRIASPRRPSPVLQPPQIWISSYMEVDTYGTVPADNEFKQENEYQNQFVSKNGSDYILYDMVDIAIYTCQARYPIKWSVPHMEQFNGSPRYIIRADSSRAATFTDQNKDPMNQYFKSQLIIYLYSSHFFSVDLSCKSADSKRTLQAESTIHLYFASEKVLEKEGQTITVSINDGDLSSDTPVVLPCRVSLPTTPITLEKKVDEEWKQVSSIFLTYNPKVGFALKKHLKPKKVLGLYRCTVNGSDVGEENDFHVHVNVTTGSEEETLHHFESRSIVTGKASIQITDDNQFLCCTGIHNRVPKLHEDSCGEELQCEVLKSTNFPKLEGKIEAYNGHKLENSSNCSTTTLYDSPTLIDCHGDDVEYQGELIILFKTDAGVVENRSNYVSGNLEEYHSGNMGKFKDVANLNGVKQKEKALIIVGYKISTGVYLNKGYFRNVLFPIMELDNSKSIEESCREKYRKNRGLPRIAEYERNFYYEDEPLQIMCFGLKYFYNDGSHLRINWKNGSKSILPFDADECDKYVHFHGNMDLGMSYAGSWMSYVFGEEVKANLDMESVDCFLPVKDSSDWEKLTYSIQTVPSIPPTFSKGDETVYFKLNEIEKAISWEINGTPKPEVNVTKDGRMLSGNFYEINLDEYRNETGGNSITIKFSNAIYEIHGSYKITASNIKGRAEKVINVVVTGTKSIAVPTCIVIVVLLTALLVMIGIKYKLQLKEMWNLRERQL